MSNTRDGVERRTDQILTLSAPYDNDYQGHARRVVFCCSVGLLRSPTAAHLAASRHGMNSRSVGVHEKALQRLSVNLIEWAYQIVFVNQDTYQAACKIFDGTPAARSLHRKARVWELDDEYDYMAHRLVEALTPLLEELHRSPLYCPLAS